jgi:FdhD protein
MKFQTGVDQSGAQQRTVRRHRVATTPQALEDSVAEEMPVALVFNGIAHAVMMVTPRQLEAFALGFALTEGLIGQASDVFDIEVTLHQRSAEVALTISQQSFNDLKQQRRSMAGRSGCGVCGLESLEQIDLHPERITTPPLHDDAGLAHAVAQAVAQFGHQQELMRSTGGVHAAGWCDVAGNVQLVCEDVGRHNALDKLIGALAAGGVDMRAGFVFMSSRASYELVRKVARMQIPLLATISAPSTLAIDIAATAGVKLVSFCRQDACVEYT